jgi:hypothetical protein
MTPERVRGRASLSPSDGTRPPRDARWEPAATPGGSLVILGAEMPEWVVRVAGILALLAVVLYFANSFGWLDPNPYKGKYDSDEDEDAG